MLHGGGVYSRTQVPLFATPMDWQPQALTVHEIVQERILSELPGSLLRGFS